MLSDNPRAFNCVKLFFFILTGMSLTAASSSPPELAKTSIQSTEFNCDGVIVTFREMTVDDYSDVLVLVKGKNDDVKEKDYSHDLD